VLPALEARRAQLRDREAGFTLIELLVVVIIIGVLAAIAIPVYLGVQNNARDSSAKGDLVNARLAVQAYYNANSSWPSLSGTDGSANYAALKDFGWTGTAALDASSTAGGSSASFCIKQSSLTGDATVFYTTQSAAPTSTKPAGCS
jgi:type IV pilus assembly protein PilA